MRRLDLILAVTLLIASSPTANAAQLYGDVERGREIAGRWCTGCHSTGGTQDDRIPSLPALARNLAGSERAIRAFLMQPHRPMPPLEISNQQIEDIVAYLHSLPAAAAR
ncbi:MAG: cytochrome c family protein [Rhodospirillaceae bacterium]